MDYINKVIVHTIVDEENRMTTYRVMSDSEHPATAAGDAGIYSALCQAARDVWPYLTTGTPGSYTAEELCNMKKVQLSIREGMTLPAHMETIQIECGTFTCRLCLVDRLPHRMDWRFHNLFSVLAQFTKFAGVKKEQRPVFVEENNEKGELLCHFRFVVPQDIKHICKFVDPDSVFHPQVAHPAIDIERGVLVATDSTMMVMKKIELTGVRIYANMEDAILNIPVEIADMNGEVVAAFYENGCEIIDSTDKRFYQENCGRYPKWYSALPAYKSCMMIVGKDMTKAVKSAAQSMTQRGKSGDEYVVLQHDANESHLKVAGHDFLRNNHTESVVRDVADDTVLPFRESFSAEKLIKMLAMKPSTMYLGLSKYSKTPTSLVMEKDYDGHTVMMLCPKHIETCDNPEFVREWEKTADRYVVQGDKMLRHGFDEHSAICEVERSVKGDTPKPKKPTSPVAAVVQPSVSLSEKFRARLRSAMGIAV